MHLPLTVESGMPESGISAPELEPDPPELDELFCGSGGVGSIPPTQVNPTQHSEVVWQVAPPDRQTPGSQLPPL